MADPNQHNFYDQNNEYNNTDSFAWIIEELTPLTLTRQNALYYGRSDDEDSDNELPIIHLAAQQDTVVALGESKNTDTEDPN